MECQTTRGLCEQTAAVGIVMGCCGQRVVVCQMHAEQGRKEWNSWLVKARLSDFMCGYCGREHMPRPEWTPL